MPWAPEDALKHQKLATTPKLQRMWAHVANSALERGLEEGAAIASANSVIRKNALASKKKRKFTAKQARYLRGY